MKNLLFGLIAIVMFSFNGFANVSELNTNKISNIKELSQEVRIEYTYGNKKVVISKSFDSQGTEMKAFLDSELEKISLILNSVDSTLLQCSVTIRAGTANNYIEVTVSGECSAVVAEAKRLKAQLMASF